MTDDASARPLGPSEVVADVDVSPFDLAPRGPATGAAALCLHGLTGTPYEARPLGEALADRGVRAVGIWMAGHNGTVDDLARTSRHAWVSRARAELEALREAHERVYLAGVSMGGVVSLRLAEERAVDGLVTVGAPLALAPPIPLVMPLLRLFSKGRPKGPAGVQDPEARARHPHFPVMPYAAVHELVRLQREVRRDLARIEAPILAANGLHDDTATPDNAGRILSSVSTPAADRLEMLLERSGHVATVDYDGPALAKRAAAFLLGERD